MANIAANKVAYVAPKKLFFRASSTSGFVRACHSSEGVVYMERPRNGKRIIKASRVAKNLSTTVPLLSIHIIPGGQCVKEFDTPLHTGRHAGFPTYPNGTVALGGCP
jgi:hypothetical protein